MHNIHIIKPGCDPNVVKANKTNLQLRELQMLKSALATAGCTSDERTVDILTSDMLVDRYMSMQGDIFFVFNSAKCFDDDLDRIIRVLSMINDAFVIFVSNDCRLKLSTANLGVWTQFVSRIVSRSIRSVIITNATTNLDSYARLVAPAFSKFVPCMHVPLDMLPCALRSDNSQAKTTDIVFCCMHFKDYDKSRKSVLQSLQDAYGDRIVFTGDMEGLLRDGKQIDSIVTDTKDVSQWYAPAKVTPVVLEDKYAKFGVQPNRLSEALTNGCVPIVLASNGSSILYRNWFMCVSSFDSLVKQIDELVSNEDYRQTILSKQLEILADRRSILLDRLKMLTSFM